MRLGLGVGGNHQGKEEREVCPNLLHVFPQALLPNPMISVGGRPPFPLFDPAEGGWVGDMGEGQGWRECVKARREEGVSVAM
jgi:hypothetical protein